MAVSPGIRVNSISHSGLLPYSAVHAAVYPVGHARPGE